MPPQTQENLSQQFLNDIFPPHKADQFFEALLGDSSEGSFDIQLEFNGRKGNALELEFQLKERPGKCLACNLTTGLPKVLSRHPIIDVPGVVRQIAEQFHGAQVTHWELGRTMQISKQLHVVPLTITLEQN
ncbi:MAG: pancreas/duodenum homeobox protein 1 [Desulfovermiculus sp.]|nr:pancreas/duodenum homeobox protein 1 [Desulfovermiculus sp.]